MRKLIAACAGLAALSLLLPSQASYDPWAWLIWGREIAHLQLDTAGGPSWKPLPVLVTTASAPLGELDRGLPPAVWVAVARAGALLAAALAFRLAARLAGGGRAGATAGAVAAVALVLTPDWFQFTAHGGEAPLAVALMLWAIERHLDGRVEHALVLGTLSCLMRPEAFPFLAPYCAWAWASRPRLRPLVACALLALPVAWIVPEWIGSGSPLDGGAQARSEPAWSLSHAQHPWLRALVRVHNHVGLAVELLALLAVAAAFVRRSPIVLALAAAALAEIALFVAMTQSGFSGNPRYVLPALTLCAVLAGVGCARLLAGGPPRAALGLAVLALVGAPFVQARVERTVTEAREVGVRMQVHRDLTRAVREAGGPRAVAALGSATTNRALHTRLAWELGVPIQRVERMIDHRVVFRSSREPLIGRVYLLGRPRRRVALARVGSVRAYAREGISFRFTRSLQGIHTRESGGRNRETRVVTR